jgi:flagellar motor protein MotB
MDGQVLRQTSSYRQGLVLGLTMAEIMLLLVFCLLLAMATFVRKEQMARAAAEQMLRNEQEVARADREFTGSIKRNPELAERLSNATTSGDPKAIDEFWRELVESHAAMQNLVRQEGISLREIRERLREARKIRERNITIDKATRDAEIAAALAKVFPRAVSAAATPKEIADALEKALQGRGPSGHQWPPIIDLSDAKGYSFKSGSAELSEGFRRELEEKIPTRILENIKQYDVDVVEVVGHTDENPLPTKQSNLDRDLLAVLKSNAGIASLVPADNAGLGLARAVSVVSVLRQSKELSRYKIIPLSGAQLVNTDETLAITGTPGDIPQRRRIEIRLRKTAFRESSDQLPAPEIAPVPVPPVRAKRPPQRPLQSAPNPFPAPLTFPRFGN